MILSLFAIIKLSAGIAILHNGCSVHAGTHDNNFGSLYLCKVFLNDGLVYLAKVSLKMAKVSLKPENFSYLPLPGLRSCRHFGAGHADDDAVLWYTRSQQE